MCRLKSFSFLFLILGVICHVKGDETCNLSTEQLLEIASYQPIVQLIIDAALNGAYRNVTYTELAKFADKFGNRISGSQNLENSIDYMISKSTEAGLENVHGEEAQVPHWVRGSESATLEEPRHQDLYILGLGNSVATPPLGISAEVLVVRSFTELTEKAELARGKIVVFNQHFVSYGVTVEYRSRGATEAARVGAVASLIKSVGAFSLHTPHTGTQSYGIDVEKIPTASITIEDAHLLQRLQDAGETIRILLKMEAQSRPEETSRNVVAEVTGAQQPEKVVIISGHIDSWDVGAGVMDDGGGLFISWAAAALLKSLNLRPKRTVRSIFWTAEEFGYVGAQAYADAHENETDNFVFMMEADSGTFNPVGLEYAAGDEGGCILQEIMNLLAPINATKTVKLSSVGSDISIWTGNVGVPGASLLTENERYTWYHHTNADTMETEDPVVLDKNTALWASVAYVIADLDLDFPRDRSPGNGADIHLYTISIYFVTVHIVLYLFH